MKKIYNQPELKVVLLQSNPIMIAGFNSTLNTNGQNGSSALVKGNVVEPTNRGSYNVWDDDWSE
jgi:hypothetical protein